MSDFRDRGQVQLDFVVGASVLLLTLAFIAGLLPSTVGPFTGQDEHAEWVTAERVGSHLTDHLLVPTNESGTLDVACTVAFFGGSGDDAGDAGCPLTAGDPLSTQLSVSDRQNVNVSAVGNIDDTDSGNEPLCWDKNDDTIVEKDVTSACNIPFQVGSSLSGTDGGASARRTVTIAGQDAMIVVEVW